MKKITLFVLLFLCFQLSFSQNYNQIPESHLKHPELGKNPLKSGFQTVEYELVHLRTKYSKTYLNTNKTKTTVQSSSPMH
jgi:hypothetical protein